MRPNSSLPTNSLNLVQTLCISLQLIYKVTTPSAGDTPIYLKFTLFFFPYSSSKQLTNFPKLINSPTILLKGKTGISPIIQVRMPAGSLLLKSWVISPQSGEKSLFAISTDVVLCPGYACTCYVQFPAWNCLYSTAFLLLTSLLQACHIAYFSIKRHCEAGRWRWR